jgi:hypothetical protein
MSTNFIIPHAIRPLTSFSCAIINQKHQCYCHCIKLLHNIATFGMCQCYHKRYNTCYCDTRATSIFIMKGMPVKNLRRADHSITISLPDGSKVSSTHICDIIIPGPPTILMRHIIPGITMASLIDIRILCKVGCKVTFDIKKCKILYKDNTIYVGIKTPQLTYGPYRSPPTRLQRLP